MGASSQKEDPMFRAILASAACAVLVAAPPLPSRSPVRTVLVQIEAFNAHDPGAFAAAFAEDQETFDFPATPLGPPGRAALMEAMARRFQEHPDLHISVKEQMVSGAFVIQRERTSGWAGGKPAVEGVTIYQVERGLIRKRWSLP